MPQTHFVLDGAQDPKTTTALCHAWRQAGFNNRIDPAAQAAGLSINGQPLTESQADQATALARRFGLEVRDRVGQAFEPANKTRDLRQKITYEYRCRTATALVFGLPAIGLHYLAPILAGGPSEPRSLFYPWLFEALLVGWMCIAAGWPILWQGALALRHRRPNGDLLTAWIILFALAPSAAGALCLITGNGTWLGTDPASGPSFHAAAYAVTLAVTQRWLLHRTTDHLAGHGHEMIVGFGKLVVVWILASIVVAVLGGWHLGLALALLLPPCASSGAINPWTPGWLSVLPVFGFAGFFLLAPSALAIAVDGIEIEIAAGFAAIMTITHAFGWKHTHPIHMT